MKYLTNHFFSVACVAIACGLAAVAQAGGGPENLFLVVNSSSSDSITVANAYANLRGIPPINALMLPWQESTESVDIASFRSELLDPVLKAIDERRLAAQIDCVVYSSDFPWRIDFANEMPAAVMKQDLFKFPSGSLTGMTMLYGAVRSGQGPVWQDPKSNRYWRPLDADGIPVSTDGFRGWHRYGPQGEVTKTAGNRYLLSVMLGVTSGRGNSVAEIISGLQTAAAADGTHPKGTIYFVTSDDVRTTTRSPAFPPIVKALDELNVKAEVMKGTVPMGKRDVAGLMMGAADFDWPASQSQILPGAICENLTSFGGIFTPSAGQTPLSAFMRAGAAGSSGTVVEPYALQAKFPHAAIQLHYVRGATLAEAFYQAVQSPYQLIVVGDPLCRPWATIPKVEVVMATDSAPITAGSSLSGRIDLQPQATIPEPTLARSGDRVAAIERFALFIDGVRLAECDPGQLLPLDTAQFADGYHELRVVATEASSVKSQGRWVMPVRFANHGRTLKLTVEPTRVSVAGAVRVSVMSEGLDNVAVYSMGRVLGRTSGADTTIEVPAELLGCGRVMIRATGRAGLGAANGVNADPVAVEVIAKDP